jgi:hypothetical protein
MRSPREQDFDVYFRESGSPFLLSRQPLPVHPERDWDLGIGGAKQIEKTCGLLSHISSAPPGCQEPCLSVPVQILADTHLKTFLIVVRISGRTHCSSYSDCGFAERGGISFWMP